MRKSELQELIKELVNERIKELNKDCSIDMSKEELNEIVKCFKEHLEWHKTH